MVTFKRTSQEWGTKTKERRLHTQLIQKTKLQWYKQVKYCLETFNIPEAHDTKSFKKLTEENPQIIFKKEISQKRSEETKQYKIKE